MAGAYSKGKYLSGDLRIIQVEASVKPWKWMSSFLHREIREQEEQRPRAKHKKIFNISMQGEQGI